MGAPTIKNKIVVKDLVVGYYGTPILHGVSFEIDKPGIYIVLGKNGAGKTTLFRAISGILAPYSGYVTIDGQMPNTHEHTRRKIAFLSHLDALPEGYTVQDSLRIFAEIDDVPEKRIEEVVHFLGLADLMRLSVNRLSRGQKRRVSLAKSILSEKDFYILDEPTSGIDPKGVAEIRSFLRALSKKKIILYSTQNLLEVSELSSNVIVISDGELKFFGDIDSIQKEAYIVGIRGDGIERILPDAQKNGPYYIVELGSQEQLNNLIEKLMSGGARIREIRELENPLEKFFE